jgi:alpha-beta hydrolase superfamily lysophospholipase
MYDAWSEVRDQILAAVGSASDTYPDYKVVSAGHSLGAGIATFAAAELRNAGFITDMVRSFSYIANEANEIGCVCKS